MHKNLEIGNATHLGWIQIIESDHEDMFCLFAAWKMAQRWWGEELVVVVPLNQGGVQEGSQRRGSLSVG